MQKTVVKTVFLVIYKAAEVNNIIEKITLMIGKIHVISYYF
jgi:hypothetical protein